MAAKLIWDKGSESEPKGGDLSCSVAQRIRQFTAGEDVVLDRSLFLFDIRATRAHAAGLSRIGVLSEAECKALDLELEQLADDFTTGSFVLDDTFEDGHSAIESVLTDRLGDLGKKIHTGRSRNDQVLAATRLFMRDALDDLCGHCLESARVFLDRAESEMLAPMPGYTHLQRAVPSSVGLWFAGHAESFIDDAHLIVSTRDWINCCPLGTAAGYGVNLALDREGVAGALGFDRVQINPQSAQNSRGRFEWQALAAAAQVLHDVARFAWDLSLFTTSEFDFVRLPDEFVTGSSIMPNKRNPDVIELLRAAPAVVLGAMSELQAIAWSLPSGYHRDLQGTKAPFLRGMTHCLRAMSLLPDLVGRIELNHQRMRAAISAEMYATDRAMELALEGVPFREAYRQAAAEIGELGARDPVESLKARLSPGAPGNPRLDVLRDRLNALAEARPSRCDDK